MGEKLKICDFSILIWDRILEHLKTRFYKFNGPARFEFFSVRHHVVAVRLLSGQSRLEDAARAHEGAPKKRAGRGPVPGKAPSRRTCVAPRAPVASAARRRRAPVQRVQRHGIVLHQGRHPGGH